MSGCGRALTASPRPAQTFNSSYSAGWDSPAHSHPENFGVKPPGLSPRTAKASLIFKAFLNRLYLPSYSSIHRIFNIKLAALFKNKGCLHTDALNPLQFLSVA